MDSAKQQLVEKLKSSNNVLVTVSRNPSVDQLAALLGLSLLLNKNGKHCAAVFSGQIPSTLEFLKPEDTIEKNTDSLRDFIIALDKSKADKLRYKVEDNVVRIFITPYRTSITDEDLEFSQGDFNVDIVVALGVKDQADLDEAIMAHGRILHDAIVASINVSSDGALGSINWDEPNASSLSELVTDLAQILDENNLDEQIATALLTGIVSETDRFSNDKTSSLTMAASAVLMAAGANQQLVATKLKEPEEVNSSPQESDQLPPKTEDGTLEIDHKGEAVQPKDSMPEPFGAEEESSLTDFELPPPKETDDIKEVNEEVESAIKPNVDLSAGMPQGPKLITEPPTMGGTLTANSTQNDIDPVTDPFSLPSSEAPQLLERKPDTFPALNNNAPISPIQPEPPAPALRPFPVTNDSALTQPPPAPATPDTLTPFPSSDDINIPPPPAPVPVSPLVSNPYQPMPGTPPAPPENISVASDNTNTNDTVAPIGSSTELHIDEDGTLSQLEEAVGSPHLNASSDSPDPNSAREEVNKALSSLASVGPQPPIEALNAQPLGPELHPVDTQPSATATNSPQDSSQPQPPPVPPPIPFEFGKPS